MLKRFVGLMVMVSMLAVMAWDGVLMASEVSQLQGITGKIGNEDIYWGTGAAADTFSVPTYSGGTLTLTKIPSLSDNITSIIKGSWYISGSNSVSDNSDADQNGSLAWVLAQIGSDPGHVVLLPGSYAVGDDLSIPANIRLTIRDGAYLEIESGKTVTFSTPENIEVSNNQRIFSGAGTVAFTYPGIVYANWWGAKEDATDAAGTTDAIQAAITAAAPVPASFDYDDQSDHAGVVKLACGHYLIDTPLTIPAQVVGFSIEGECGAMHGFGQTIIQWAGETMDESDDWMIDAGSVMGFRLSRIHLIGNADDDSASSATIQNGVFVRRVNSGFYASGNMWEDVTIRRFPGIGVQWGDYTETDGGDGSDTTNTDNSYIKNLMIQDCRIGMVIDSPNFLQVLFDRLFIGNYGGNPVSGSTPIEQAGSAPIKFRTKNAVQILHGKLHAVDAHLYASYADTDAYSQYAIYALNGSFNILSGYSEAYFFAYVADGTQSQGQQDVNTISNFHLFPGTAGGPATAGKYAIYYAKSYRPLVLISTKGLYVKEASTSAGVVTLGVQNEPKYASRYVLGESDNYETRNPQSYDWGLTTMSYDTDLIPRWNVAPQIGAASSSFESPDYDTFRLTNNLIRGTYLSGETPVTMYTVFGGDADDEDNATIVNVWDFTSDGIRHYKASRYNTQNTTMAEIVANDQGQFVYSASPGAGELQLYNDWAEYNATRKVGYRFGLDRRQITFWGELDGSSASSDEILIISGIVDCDAMGLSEGEKFYVAANGNGEFLPLSFGCGVSEGSDYLTLAHGDWPDNSTRIDRVSLDGITIFVK